jgi:hypothetical protein
MARFVGMDKDSRIPKSVLYVPRIWPGKEMCFALFWQITSWLSQRSGQLDS